MSPKTTDKSGSAIQRVRAWNEKHWNLPLALALMTVTVAAFAIIDPFGRSWTYRVVTALIGIAVFAAGELYIRADHGGRENV